MTRFSALIAALVLVLLSTITALAQPAKVGVAGAGTLVVKALAEKKIAELPRGPLFWRVDTFPTLAQAQAAATPTSLVAQVGDEAWLFTLGPAGAPSSGGTKMAEIGPLPSIVAPSYLLRVNEASGRPGSISPVHSHHGAEAVYVLAGEESFRTPHGVKRVGAGESDVSHSSGTPMQVSSTGSADLHALVLFVVDATKPFSSPATLP
jgi:quercetin dioxygenase-like cupin family protein